jgi:hypothetical protein
MSGFGRDGPYHLDPRAGSLPWAAVCDRAQRDRVRAWSVRADLLEDVAGEIDRLARAEPPVNDLRAAPAFADRTGRKGA